MNPLQKLKENPFPFQVFGDEIATSMLNCAKIYNIPPQFMGLTALFTLAGLSGSMYIGEANGGIKTMIYGLIIGPSGVGKTPAYRILCGNVIKDIYNEQKILHEQELKIWQMNERNAARNKTEFNIEKPTLPIRMATEGTTEGFINKAAHIPCGFGIYYDEGGDMLSINKYRGGGGANNFWNKIWNGDPYLDVKVDQDRERYVHNPAISVLASIQTDKVREIITPDGISSGIAARMLMVKSDYIELIPSDPFGPKPQMCEKWQRTVIGLHNRGFHFDKKSIPTKVHFEYSAKLNYTRTISNLTLESNSLIRSKLDAKDISAILIGYSSKISQYFSRFCVLLAILEDYENPIIKNKHVEHAELLYRHFFETAKDVLSEILGEQNTGLSTNEERVLNELPVRFSSKDAEVVCSRLKLNEKFFLNSFRRGKFKDLVKKDFSDYGMYQKI